MRLRTLVATSLIVGSTPTLLLPATFREMILEYFEPLPSETISNNTNQATQAQIELGKTLYFDTRLSADWDVSCASCHDIFNGGDDGMELSVGHQGLTGRRNAPTVLNAGFNVVQFWDGRADTLADQAKGPIQAPVEMANTPENVIKTLKAIPWYRAQFDAAFPYDETSLTFDNLALAVEAFEQTLVTPSRFDDFLNGDEGALSPDELYGAFAFVDSGCSVCHSGVNIGGGYFERLGMVNELDRTIFPIEDKGVFAVTNDPTDIDVFRIAPLRNVSLTAPYFHSGRAETLEEAIEIMARAQLGTTLSTIDLNGIAAFLTSLEGRVPNFDMPDIPEFAPVFGPEIPSEEVRHLYEAPKIVEALEPVPVVVPVMEVPTKITIEPSQAALDMAPDEP